MAAIEYKELDHEAAEIDSAIDLIVNHVANTAIHVTQAEKDSWNAKASSSDVAAEAQARQAADESLQAAIDDKANAADLTSETAAREQADAKYESVLAGLIDGESKNIMPISNPLTTETKRGITVTYDFAAGTVTLNGEHDGTGDAQFYLYTGNAADQKVIPAGSYHLSGCPEGGSTETYCLIVQNVGGSPAYKLDTGNGQDFTISADGRMAPIIRVRKPAGQTVSFDNVIFKPMICSKDAWEISQKFVPYYPSISDLYAMILALQS